MARVSPFERSINLIFKRLGEQANYIKTNGETLEILVISSRGDFHEKDSYDNYRLGKVNVFEFRHSQILKPIEGDRITFKNIEYQINSEPIEDELNLSWKVFCDVSNSN